MLHKSLNTKLVKGKFSMRLAAVGGRIQWPMDTTTFTLLHKIGINLQSMGCLDCPDCTGSNMQISCLTWPEVLSFPLATLLLFG